MKELWGINSIVNSLLIAMLLQVANKVVEMVMIHGGCDVCCVADADRERMERISREVLIFVQ